MAGGWGVLIGTLIAITLGILGFGIVPGPDKSLHRLMAVTAVVCMWLMWLCVYMSQMNPLITPEKSDD